MSLADDQTKIIPGHGPLASKVELTAYLEMLKGVRDALKPLVDSGKTMADIAAAKPLAPFDAVWGDGFLPPEKFLSIAVDSMKLQP